MKQQFTFDAWPVGTPCWVLERDVMRDGECPCCGTNRWTQTWRAREGTVSGISAKLNRAGVLKPTNTVKFPDQGDLWDSDPDSLLVTQEAADAALAAMKGKL